VAFTLHQIDQPDVHGRHPRHVEVHVLEPSVVDQQRTDPNELHVEAHGRRPHVEALEAGILPLEMDSGLYATKRGERLRSLAVRCVCHLTPQCNSRRSR
jgi:hypothetical protein